MCDTILIYVCSVDRNVQGLWLHHLRSTTWPSWQPKKLSLWKSQQCSQCAMIDSKLVRGILVGVCDHHPEWRNSFARFDHPTHTREASSASPTQCDRNRTKKPQISALHAKSVANKKNQQNYTISIVARAIYSGAYEKSRIQVDSMWTSFRIYYASILRTTKIACF